MSKPTRGEILCAMRELQRLWRRREDDDMEEVVITAEQLAEVAAVCFLRADVPDKIWANGYGGTNFIRATWADGITARRANSLERMKEILEEAYPALWVAVGYEKDFSWKTVDKMAAALSAVK